MASALATRKGYFCAPQRGHALFQQYPGPFEVSLRAQGICQGANGKASAEGATKLAGYGEGLLAQVHRPS